MSVKTIKRDVIKNMQHLGTYREEFDSLIDIYAGMLHQYRVFEKELAENGYQVIDEKNYRLMEKLRKDINAYATNLLLNPKSYKPVKDVVIPKRKEVVEDKEVKKPLTKLQMVMGGK
ncbi:phage terminase small subunit [Cytobacillus firmus]|uniref:Phage terminase small subunit n=2 Tax=Cytobacillus TaxID=2675230 RepID=A0A366JPN5_CYTFI|nr:MULTISPECIES: P27 family phage terminase small subunit [Cytobacillus]RBP89388.1 phage terminase small subunit [Cytobacillus firmus]TDX47385.1 phage terminase small subunit [Cytobacillus oceanisediminis]